MHAQRLNVAGTQGSAQGWKRPVALATGGLTAAYSVGWNFTRGRSGQGHWSTSPFVPSKSFDGALCPPGCQPPMSVASPYSRGWIRAVPPPQVGQRGSIRFHQVPRSRSNAAPSAITGPSWPGGPTNWTPMGSPDIERPHGVDTAGNPRRLHGIALRDSTIK